jgi:hypothetical protein
LCGLAAWAVLSAATAQAAVIYDNGATPVNAAGASDSAGLIRADDFTLAAGANVVTDIHWTGLYAQNAVPATDNFTIQLFADTGAGAPTTVPLLSLAIGNATRTDSGTDIAGHDLFSYSVNVAPIVLSAGTPYWLSIFNDTSADDPLVNTWTWGERITGSTSDTYAIRNQVPDWGSVIGSRLDFQLTGDSARSPVPGPTPLVLVVGALVALHFRRPR